MSGALTETAFAKVNLALHVRGRRDDGRHEIETIYVFCEDGDRLAAEPSAEFELDCSGEFAWAIASDNLVRRAWQALSERAGKPLGIRFSLDKRLPVASGIGGGSADAAAALRLMTSIFDLDPALAREVAPALGSDVPACLASEPSRGDGAGDELTPLDLPELHGKPVLLVNPRVQLETASIFARWGGVDRGPLTSWREGRNDLEAAAAAESPQITTVLAWLSAQPGAEAARMSGSGATCFALFDSEEQRDRSSDAVPREWWRLATRLR